jgi:transcriptional regulator with GAF, ATPase, and Fis domain
MERFQTVLLAVWQEACRHIAISQSAAKIADMLVHHVPIDQLLLRRIDSERSCLETVAAEPVHADRPQPDARTQCSKSEMKKLLAWCRRGEIAGAGGQEPLADELRFVMPSGVDGNVLVGPLGGRRRPSGVLILVASPGRTFNTQHAALMRVLLDPLSVALENDQRLHEMAVLRQAAEADKQSLLARLGRTKLGDTIVGADAGLRGVMERVELVARSDVPVLIFGETGTGKELVARVIHARSPRHAGPVQRVNCGAIPPELIDSQLFGHEKGAFTGAVETREGWFERADGGTLFLDEIGELPLAAQVRLLRVLQDGWLERVGGQRPVHVDVRIVAATHRDLAVMVAEGKFREDLWYRLAVFPILLPMLRERLEDIPELAVHFAERAATRFGLPLMLPSAEDIGLLVSYAWPGNVRELATVIDRAAILGNGKHLEVAKALGVKTNVQRVPIEREKPTPTQPLSPEIAPLENAIRKHIEAALAATHGRIEGPHGAAVLLAINPHTLRARMRKLGIDWRRFRS